MYLWDPERARERIEHNLNEGKEVTLIGENGMPRWKNWVTTGETQKVFLKNGIVCVESWDLALLEILRDPQVPRYSFSAWVRHDTTDGFIGEVGIYFAHRRRALGRGVESILWTVKFNGLDDFRRDGPNFEGNPVSLRVERYPEPGWAGNRETAGLPVYLPVSIAEGAVWRKIAVEVLPEKIRYTIWRDSQLGTESQSREVALEEVGEVENRVCQPLGKFEDAPPEIATELALRGSLGLYVYKGSASYCNTVVRPLPD